MAVNKKRVILAQDSSMLNSSRVVELLHPRTRSPVPFLYSSSTSSLSELLSCSQSHRGWFHDDSIISKGEVYVAVEVDLILLLLPYLVESSEVLRPLDQVVEKESLLSNIASENETLRSRLTLVADLKGDQDLNVWAYNETKTLNFLAKKVLNVTKVIEESHDDIRVDGSASVAGFVKSNRLHNKDSDEEKDARLHYAWGIVSEYLTQPLSSRLFDFMHIKKPLVANAVSTASSPPSKRLKSCGNGDGPSEDYSKDFNKSLLEKEKPLSGKMKQLAKSANGSKHITSFFKKK